ncbi:dihydrofolate reductase [Legionella anisa]|uniref:Dihydrofolate reductase n=1 Tax=Legionella anisa TaxID=28082 RepID=A0AAX0WQF4_9GAMM|nr:dihydrofolate reductase [Legionella anisa]AWN75512.1 dihydrofolate reductase [Legionella anisa]KTC76298.1 dihydrofolate reductase FolA [Legionella anisa]MBN5937112.1 dihydrofolate reductase [Legionella anisa]MCW8424298.1 dihydrofolate reductase [Legionella anisa]MCW8446584.1 dihydrofolate reductase [Legionella anisa]
MISLIAAIDETGGLGFNNQLLCHLPADLQHFKSITMGKPIIMGRKTFASIGKPLPGRLNIVLSHSVTSIEGVSVFNSLEKAINQTKEFPEIMIIGGAELFAEAMNKAARLYITRIHHQFIADVFFPEIDESIWHCHEKQFRPHDEKNEYDMTFYTYERTK